MDSLCVTLSDAPVTLGDADEASWRGVHHGWSKGLTARIEKPGCGQHQNTFEAEPSEVDPTIIHLANSDFDNVQGSNHRFQSYGIDIAILFLEIAPALALGAGANFHGMLRCTVAGVLTRVAWTDH